MPMKQAAHTRQKTVTHGRPTARAMHPAPEFFDLLFENSFDAVVRCDKAGIILKTNPSFCTLSKYAHEDIVGRPFADVLFPGPGSYVCTTGMSVEIGPDFAKELQSVFSRLAEQGFVSGWQSWLVRKDQTALYVEHRLTALCGPDGRPAGSLCILRDITEKAAMQEALQKSEDRFRTFFEYAPDAIYISDESGIFIDGNRSAEQMTGYSREDLIGRNYFDLDLLSPEQFPRALELLEHNISGSPTGPDEFILKRRDGRRVTVEICTYPLYIQGERCVLGVAHDITDHKRAEAILNRDRDELEHKVRERTRDLEEANTALGVLLKTRDEDRAAMEQSMLHNLHDLVLPCIEKLRSSRLHARQQAVLEMLETNLRDITSPMMRAVTMQHLHFTPAEVSVANCVRHGMSTREIAELLQLSIKTVHFHRENIRRKCGIKNKKVNLRTFLASLA